jgi:succinate-acetate transporter protein
MDTFDSERRYTKDFEDGLQKQAEKEGLSKLITGIEPVLRGKGIGITVFSTGGVCWAYYGNATDWCDNAPIWERQELTSLTEALTEIIHFLVDPALFVLTHEQTAITLF